MDAIRGYLGRWLVEGKWTRAVRDCWGRERERQSRDEEGGRKEGSSRPREAEGYMKKKYMNVAGEPASAPAFSSCSLHPYHRYSVLSLY